MKKFAAALLLSAAVCGAYAQSLRHELQSSSKALHKIFMDRDADGFKKYVGSVVTPDFQYVENGKTESFDTMCEGIAQGFAMIKKMKSTDIRILSLHQAGDSGTAKIRHSMTGITSGPDGKDHVMTFSGVSTDSYVKDHGKWLMSKMVWEHQEMKMDGKTMPAGAMGGQ